jgi:ribosomal protein L11 methyltransferase
MLALVVTVHNNELELAADELWSLGVVAVEERAQNGTVSTELWTSLGDDTESITDALGALRWPWRFEIIDESVSNTWRLHAQPTWICNDLVVHPAWRDASAYGSDPAWNFAGAIAIPIEPGATFGMGDHPTTVLSMRALRACVRAGDHVLDVGCGSGVLAIAAVLFGAEHATAIDISPASIPTTVHNAELSGVRNRIAVATTPLADVRGVYRVVVANILAPTLIDLSADLRRVLAPGGRLIISGILADRHEHVLDALFPLRPTARQDLDGWTVVTLDG